MRAVIVGAGLCGSVVGRKLAEAGYNVEILERRNHIAGNMYDYKDEHGINVHKYGPHCFHTHHKYLFSFMQQFEDWQEFHCTCGAVINRICTPSPFNYKTIDDFFDGEEAEKIKAHLKNTYSNQKTVTVLDALNSNDEFVRKYAHFLFDNDYSLYTAKQWGVSPDKIDPSILKRVPLRLSYKEGYFDDPYQFVPVHSYTSFFENLLHHQNITIKLNVDALNEFYISNGVVMHNENEFDGLLIYTGALDELFGHCYGELPYRSLRFEWKYSETDSFQKYPLVAYPQEKDFTRITEYKKLPNQNVHGSSYAVEYPLMYSPGTKIEPYYPLLTEESQNQYLKYKELAQKVNGLVVVGRLADFKYYNMDQALDRALKVADNILEK